MESSFRGESMNILLHGCNGRMGQVLTRLIPEEDDMNIAAGVDSDVNKFKNSYPVYNSLKQVKEKFDLLIDFSNHTAIENILNFGLSKKVPLVICTTGFTDEEKNKMLEASKQIPIFNSSNMSLGVNLLISLSKQAAQVLGSDYDIEIIEKHHNQKLDSPSGTALMIADAINKTLGNNSNYVYGRHSKTSKRDKNEIGIHSVRGGGVVGEHEVLFLGSGDVIEIKHSAISRDVFGYGAIKAARFIIDKNPKLYSMDDLI
jgi:4-hydroxy-tetrahydrodipicolinate reductase